MVRGEGEGGKDDGSKIGSDLWPKRERWRKDGMEAMCWLVSMFVIQEWRNRKKVPCTP